MPFNLIVGDGFNPKIMNNIIDKQVKVDNKAVALVPSDVPEVINHPYLENTFPNPYESFSEYIYVPDGLMFGDVAPTFGNIEMYSSSGSLKWRLTPQFVDNYCNSIVNGWNSNGTAGYTSIVYVHLNGIKYAILCLDVTHPSDKGFILTVNCLDGGIESHALVPGVDSIGESYDRYRGVIFPENDTSVYYFCFGKPGSFFKINKLIGLFNGNVIDPTIVRPFRFYLPNTIDAKYYPLYKVGEGTYTSFIRDTIPNSVHVVYEDTDNNKFKEFELIVRGSYGNVESLGTPHPSVGPMYQLSVDTFYMYSPVEVITSLWATNIDISYIYKSGDVLSQLKEIEVTETGYNAT